MTIANIKKNIMGTVSFDGKFSGMRKEQDFIVYPVKDECEAITIQSDTRIGKIVLSTGEVLLSPSRAGGSYGVHMALAKNAGTLTGSELLLLKSNIAATSSKNAGSSFVKCDNSAAISVLNT